MYDPITRPYGTLTCAKHLTVGNGKIVRDKLTFDSHQSATPRRPDPPFVRAATKTPFAALSVRALYPWSEAMRFSINGQIHELTLDNRTSLLDLLRDHLHLSGTKKGCDQGACGACTVLVDGDRINSCLALAVQYQDRPITTIEGVGRDSALHELQSAFIDHDGFQCGYCTPGQICSAIGMAAEVRRGVPSAATADLTASLIEPTRDELRERMSGNLCRCGAHNGIVDAIEATFHREGAE